VQVLSTLSPGPATRVAQLRRPPFPSAVNPHGPLRRGPISAMRHTLRESGGDVNAECSRGHTAVMAAAMPAHAATVNVPVGQRCPSRPMPRCFAARLPRGRGLWPRHSARFAALIDKRSGVRMHSATIRLLKTIDKYKL
jgi:hypothetical protein